MKKKKPAKPVVSDMAELSADPSERLCARFDSASIAEFRVADRGEMGVRVVDNCAEQHEM